MIQKDLECPLCGELVEEHNNGVMTNNQTGEVIRIFTCEECNQAFGLRDNKLGLMPYDSDMKKINNECVVCGEIKHFNQEGEFLLPDDSIQYVFYCKDCALEFLRNWIRKNNPNKVKEVTFANICEVSSIYDFEQNNKMLQKMNEHPELMKKIRENFFKKIDDDAICEDGEE